MRSERLIPAFLVAAVLGGCGGGGDRPAADRQTKTPTATPEAPAKPKGKPKGTLRVYSSLPMRGESRAQSRNMARAIDLALKEAGGRAGDFAVKHVKLSDASAKSGLWEPPRVVANATRAVKDTRAIAYIGQFNSAASAISMPILNRAGILQVSPSNTYVGLTREEGSGKGEPERYRPTGRRTYGRLTPADHRQAAALVAWMKDARVKRIFVADDGEIYGAGLAKLFTARARKAGLRIVGKARWPGPAAASIAARARGARADGLLFAGITDNRAAELMNGVARAAPGLQLFAPDGVGEIRFTRRLKDAARERMRITMPTLDPAEYPEPGQEFYDAFAVEYGASPEPQALYAYEAMKLILDCIRRAGADGDDRAAVVKAFFATRDRDSAIGRYSIDANGDTTLTQYGGYAVDGNGYIAFDRVIDSGG